MLRAAKCRATGAAVPVTLLVAWGLVVERGLHRRLQVFEIEPEIFMPKAKAAQAKPM